MPAAEQLDLLSRTYPSLRATELSVHGSDVWKRHIRKDGAPVRYSVRNEDGVEVGSIFDAGRGAVQWYTGRGAGRAESSADAFEEIRKLLGGT